MGYGFCWLLRSVVRFVSLSILYSNDGENEKATYLEENILNFLQQNIQLCLTLPPPVLSGSGLNGISQPCCDEHSKAPMVIFEFMI